MLSSLYSVMQKFIRLLVVLTLVCKLATANLHYSYSGDPPDSPSSTPPSVNATSGVSSSTRNACGECTIIMQEAQVLYWPTPAPQPLVTSFVDGNGITFVSPSVYAVFSHLAASNACGSLGSSFDQLTATFAKTELSTLSSVEYSASCATLPFNFADLNGCVTFLDISSMTSSTASTTQSGFPEIFIPGIPTTALDILWYTKMDQRCAPSIALGAWVTRLDPAWTSCSVSANWNPAHGFPRYGPFVWDPPRALASVESLLDPIITQSSSITMAPAAPSAAPQPVAAITSTAGPAQAPSSSQAGADPPAGSVSERPSSHAPSSSPVDADPPATSASASPLSHGPLSNPLPLDGSASNHAQSAETTNAPSGASSPSDPPASDPEHLSSHATSDLLPVSAFPVGGESITAVAGSPGVFVMKGETITQGAAPATIGSLQVSWAQGSIFVNGKGASVFAPSSSQLYQPAATSASLFVATAVEGQLPGGAVVISGSTVIPGAPAVMIDNVAYSLDPAASNIVIGGQTQILSAIRPYPATTLANVFVATAVEGQLSGGAVVISGSTVIRGAPAVTINNVAYSMDPAASHIVVGGQTKPLSAIGSYQNSQPANVIIAGETVAPAAPGASAFVIGDKTLSLNGPAATIAGTPVSLASGGNIIIGTSTLTPQSRPTDPPNSAVSYFTIGGEIFTVVPGDIVAAGKTLTPGGPPITISGTPVSLGFSALIIGTQTEKITIPPAGTSEANQADAKTATTSPNSAVSYFTIGGEIFTVAPGDIVAAGKTLTPGGPPITISGTPVSLGFSALIIGTQTAKITIPPARTSEANQADAKTATTSSRGGTVSYFTVGGETFAVGTNDVVVDGKTLTPGSPGITVSGVRVSLGASAFIVGTRTEAFTAPTPGASAGIGALILSGLGGIGGGAITTGAGDPLNVFAAAAVKQVAMSALWVFPVLVCMVF